MEKTHRVAEYKKKIVADIVKYIKEYSIIGVVNMENLPAPQLQVMKAKLREKVHLFMTKKRLMKIALGQVKNDKKGIEELESHFQGMPALLFTKDSPFKLSKTLQQSKSQAPAKAGQISPRDIIIPKGPTSFAPGPIISELSSIGIKTGVEGGKVAVKEDSLVAKKNEKIKPKVAEVLTRMGIEPMEVGLDLVAAYENGIIYPKDILLIDEKEFMNKLNNACSGAFNLAVFIDYPTKDTIKILVGKAFNDAKALGLGQNIIDSEIIDELLGKAERSMLSLKSAVNIEVQEKKEEVKEEKEIEEKKPEVKEVVKPVEEVKKEEKPVEKKEEKPKEEVKEEIKTEIKEVKEPEKKIEEKAKKEVKIEKKEEEALEKEKEVIKEEQRIEEEAKEREKEEEPFEKEVEEVVKEEEEKQLEKQRIEEEKKLEDLEEKKSRIKEEIKTEEEKPESEIDKKVKKMVEDTKKFVVGEKGPTAEDLLKETKEEEKKGIKEEIKKEEPKEEKKEEVKEKEKIKKEVPSAHELAKKKKKDEKKEIEDLAQELIKKGSLRNKK